MGFVEKSKRSFRSRYSSLFFAVTIVFFAGWLSSNIASVAVEDSKSKCSNQECKEMRIKSISSKPR